MPHASTNPTSPCARLYTSSYLFASAASSFPRPLARSLLLTSPPLAILRPALARSAPRLLAFWAFFPIQIFSLARIPASPAFRPTHHTHTHAYDTNVHPTSYYLPYVSHEMQKIHDSSRTVLRYSQ